MQNLKTTLLVGLLLTSFAALHADETYPAEPINYPAFSLHAVRVGKDGKVNALVLTPEKPLPGNPWVLGSLQDVRSAPVANMTRTQLELVRRGFHFVGVSPGVVLGAPDPNAVWDTTYEVMTTKHGLAKRVALMGLSREGLPVARWAAANPGKVTCLYLDRAVCDFKSWPGGKLGIGLGSKNDWAMLQKVYSFKDEAEAMAFKENPVDLAPKLIADKVAIIYVAGEKDTVVPYVENGARMQQQYEKAGVAFQLIMRSGEDHHPHGLPDPTPVVDFIQKHAR